MDKIRVVLVEDHDLARIGLKTALRQYDSIDVVAEAASGRQGLDVLNAVQPDVAIVDIGLPDIDGIEVTKQFKATQAEAVKTKVLILTMHEDEDAVLAAFAAGADSYSVKDVKVEKLVEAILATHEGNSWIDPAIARIVLQQAQKNQPESGNDALTKTTIDSVTPEYEELLESDPLTDRELEVLALIVAGRSNAEIAEELYITVGTVKTHVRNILNKLCAADRTQAAVRALRSGLVS